MTTPHRYTGKIIHLDKGYGFITTPEIPYERIFFHWMGLVPTLKFPTLVKGQEVTFETKNFPDKGLRAIKIEKVNSNEATKDI